MLMSLSTIFLSVPFNEHSCLCTLIGIILRNHTDVPLMSCQTEYGFFSPPSQSFGGLFVCQYEKKNQ